MDFKKILAKIDLFEGAGSSMKKAEHNPAGPKFKGYWSGKNPNPPKPGEGVGGCEESILKDLSKGPKPKTKEQELAEAFDEFLETLEEDNLGVEEKRPQRKGSRPSRDYGKTGEPSKRYNTVSVNEHGDQEGYDPRGQNPFLKPGQKALKGTPMKARDVAKSIPWPKEVPSDMSQEHDDEDNPHPYDLDEAKEEFNYKVTCDGYDKGNFVDKNDAIYSAQYMIYHGEKEYKHIEVTDLSTHKKIWEWNGKKDIDEAKGDVPVISAFRRGMEKIANSGMSNQDKQAAFDRLSAEFHKNAQAYSDKVKGKAVDEDLQPMANPQAGGMPQPGQPAQSGAPAQGQAAVDPKQVQDMTQATQAVKSATQSTAPAPNISKALDAASQGKPVAANDMKAIQPLMKDMSTVAQNPQLANQFKTLAQQTQQVQQKQKQQQTKTNPQ